MSTKQIILSIALLGCIPSSSLYTMDYVKRAKESTFATYYFPRAASIALIASVFTLFYREPVPDAQQRHDWKKFFDVTLIASEPGEYFENLKYVYTDWWVGQRYKDKCLKVKKDGTIKQSRKCEPFGVLGTTSALLEVTDQTQKMLKGLAAVGIAALALNPNSFMWDKFTQFMWGKEKNKVNDLTEYQILKNLGYTDAQIAKYRGMRLPDFDPENHPTPPVNPNFGNTNTPNGSAQTS